MSCVILPNDVSQTLSQIREQVELRDEAGTLLGVFEPALSPEDAKLAEQLKKDGYPGTVADYHAAMNEAKKAIENPDYAKNWRTTEQILADLKSRP